MVATFWLISVLVAQVEPEMRFAARCADLERNLGSVSVLVKERIDRRKQQRLQPGVIFDNIACTSESAVKVKGAAVDRVLSDQISMRSRDTKVQRGKKQPVGQAECSVEFGWNLAAEVRARSRNEIRTRTWQPTSFLFC